MKTFVLSPKETVYYMFKQLLENEDAFLMFAGIYERFPECLPECTRIALEAIFAMADADEKKD